MFATLMALGALFWLALVAGVIVLAVLLEYDRVGWAGITTLVFVVALFFTVDEWTLRSLEENAGLIATTVAGYLAAGVAWAFTKWYLFLKDRRETYRDLKEEYVAAGKLYAAQGRLNPLSMDGAIPKEAQDHFRKFLRSEGFLAKSGRHSQIAPSARACKDSITGWIFWWPASLLSSLFKDLAKWIYHSLKSQFQHMSSTLR